VEESRDAIIFADQDGVIRLWNQDEAARRGAPLPDMPRWRRCLIFLDGAQNLWQEQTTGFHIHHLAEVRAWTDAAEKK
jgi:hypothetical protein